VSCESGFEVTRASLCVRMGKICSKNGLVKPMGLTPRPLFGMPGLANEVTTMRAIDSAASNTPVHASLKSSNSFG